MAAKEASGDLTIGLAHQGAIQRRQALGQALALAFGPVRRRRWATAQGTVETLDSVNSKTKIAVEGQHDEKRLAGADGAAELQLKAAFKAKVKPIGRPPRCLKKRPGAPFCSRRRIAIKRHHQTRRDLWPPENPGAIGRQRRISRKLQAPLRRDRLRTAP